MRCHRSLLLLLALGSAACAPDSPTDVVGPSFSRGGGGSGDPVATFILASPSGAVALESDGGGNYVNGQCSVTTDFVVSTTGDAILRTLMPRRGRCGRTVGLEYTLPDDTVVDEQLPVIMNVRALHTTDPITWIAPGATSRRRLAISPQAIGEPGRCGRIIFGENPDRAAGEPTFAGTDAVYVTREDRRTWNVNSGPTGTLTGYCELTTELVKMNVNFTVRADRDLQVP